MDGATDKLHRVALLLLARARRRGGFPVDPGKLADELTRVAGKIDGALLLAREGEPNWEAEAEFVIEVWPRDTDRLSLECRHGQGSVSADLRLNGALENETFGFGLGGEEKNPADRKDPYSTAITLEEQDVLQKASLAAQVEREQPTPSFHNAEFIRALTANPQPASVIQILAVELYVGGLVVHYQYDDPGVPPLLRTRLIRSALLLSSLD